VIHFAPWLKLPQSSQPRKKPPDSVSVSRGRIRSRQLKCDGHNGFQNAGQDTGKNSRTNHLTASVSEHLIMQTPSTAQIRTAIEVLKKFGEHINHNAVNTMVELSDSQLHDQQPGRIEARTIEQTTRIETVAAQLESWRNELLQQGRQCVSHHV
jgi:hypothetical protein